jgi:hypothetical protein
VLEKLGLPTVTVGTDAFVELIRLEAEQRGFADLPHVIVPHPIGGLRPPQIAPKVTPEVLAQVRAALTRPT